MINTVCAAVRAGSVLSRVVESVGFVKLILSVLGPVTVFALYKFSSNGMNFDFRIKEHKLEKIKLRHANECIQIDDINWDMMISRKNRFFTAHARVEGKDFRMLNPGDQYSLVKATQSVFASQRDPFTYRVQNRKVDYGPQMEIVEQARIKHEETLNRLEQSLSKMYEDRMQIAQASSSESQKRKLDQVSKVIQNFEKQRDASKNNYAYAIELAAYITGVEKQNHGVQKEAVFSTSYDFNRANFSTGQLEEHEITSKSRAQLMTNLGSFLSNMTSAGVRARALVTDEQEHMAYRHWHPFSASDRTKESFKTTNRDYVHIKDSYPKELEKKVAEEKRTVAAISALDKLILKKKKERENEESAKI